MFLNGPKGLQQGLIEYIAPFIRIINKSRVFVSESKQGSPRKCFNRWSPIPDINGHVSGQPRFYPFNMNWQIRFFVWFLRSILPMQIQIPKVLYYKSFYVFLQVVATRMRFLEDSFVHSWTILLRLKG